MKVVKRRRSCSSRVLAAFSSDVMVAARRPTASSIVLSGSVWSPAPGTSWVEFSAPSATTSWSNGSVVEPSPRGRVTATVRALTSTPVTSPSSKAVLRTIARSGGVMCRGSIEPLETSGSIGVKSMKFSRLTIVTAISFGRARRSSCRATFMPANPAPRITTLLGTLVLIPIACGRYGGLGINFHMAWQFGISEVTTWPWSFEDDVSRYGTLGASAIEIWEFKLDRDLRKRREQLASAMAHGLSVSSFQADVHALFPTHLKREPAALEARRDAFLKTLDTLAPMLPGTVFVLNTGIAADGDVQAAFEKTVHTYHALTRRARELGVRLALEPLHPLAMNEDSFAWNLEDALDIVDAVGSDVLGICADMWNLAGQHDLRSRLARCAGKIFLAQVSDYRRPRSFLDRLAVGDGSTDFRPFVDGLRDSAYDGPIVLEIFSKDVPDSLYDGDLDAVVRRSRDALSALFGASPR